MSTQRHLPVIFTLILAFAVSVPLTAQQAPLLLAPRPLGSPPVAEANSPTPADISPDIVDYVNAEGYYTAGDFFTDDSGNIPYGEIQALADGAAAQIPALAAENGMFAAAIPPDLQQAVVDEIANAIATRGTELISEVEGLVIEPVLNKPPELTFQVFEVTSEDGSRNLGGWARKPFPTPFLGTPPQALVQGDLPSLAPRDFGDVTLKDWDLEVEVSGTARWSVDNGWQRATIRIKAKLTLEFEIDLGIKSLTVKKCITGDFEYNFIQGKTTKLDFDVEN